jgi:hypothetical protein
MGLVLHDLYDALAPEFTESQRKDMRTALKVLAKTLGFSDPRHCPVQSCPTSLTTLTKTVERHLTEARKSPFTIRNIPSNLRRLFREAEHRGLVHLSSGQVTRQFNPRRKPPRKGSERCYLDGSYLPQRRWPEHLKAEFDAFHRWATDPIVEGRPTAWRKRHETIGEYEGVCELYFGYLHHIQKLAYLSFDQLFDIELLRRFISWHVNEKHHAVTVQLRNAIKCILTLMNQYRPTPEARAHLAAIKRSLPRPQPLYDKNDSWVSTNELRKVGEALWPSKRPQQLTGSGRTTALRASLSIIFRLWEYIPYRIRNIAEMEREKNLYRTPAGQWRIRFIGDQLKIGYRRGQPNEFDVPFPAKLLPALETYLEIWRPILVHQSRHSINHVFPNALGKPWRTKYLRPRLQYNVYSFLGKHWHPHIVRTVWATEKILEGVDFMTVAFMLNDRFETVVQRYAHLRQGSIAEDLYARIDQKYG